MNNIEQTHKLLLVDDESDFLELMSKFFKRRQIDIETASNCMDALSLIELHQFDVVVMDVHMPGLSGLECMVEIKKIKPDLEVIILTGHASLHTGLNGMKQGAFDYCIKPVDLDELLEKISLAKKKYALGKSNDNS